MAELEQNIEGFLHYLQFERRYSRHTIQAYKVDLQQFVEYLRISYDMQNGIEVNTVTPFLLKSWLSGLRGDKKLSVRTLNRKISAVRSFFRFLLRKGVIDKNPSTLLHVFKVPKRLPSFLSEEQALELLDAQGYEPENWNQRTGDLVFDLLYHTGLRVSELTALQERHVDVRAAQLKVLGKGNKERIIPLSNGLLQRMQAYIADKGNLLIEADRDHLLVNQSGRPLYPKYVYRQIRERLGSLRQLSKKSPHVIRHTFATHLLNSGAELNAIKDLLGHSSLAATQVYTHNSIEKLKDLHKKTHPKG
jgi:integrase/recombinase XerC